MDAERKKHNQRDGVASVGLDQQEKKQGGVKIRDNNNGGGVYI